MIDDQSSAKQQAVIDAWFHPSLHPKEQHAMARTGT
jgi:hypothetical protein